MASRPQEQYTNGLCGVYCITNTTTNSKYIGASHAIQARWLQHLKGLKNGTHENPLLLQDWQNYGITAFTFSVLEVFDDSALLEGKETEWLQKQGAKPIYNKQKAKGGVANKHVVVKEDTKHALQALGYPSIDSAIQMLLSK